MGGCRDEVRGEEWGTQGGGEGRGVGGHREEVRGEEWGTQGGGGGRGVGDTGRR